MTAAQVHFPDVESLQDLATFVRRARTLDADGAIRLQSIGTVLAAWVCVLPGRGVFGEGVVLGLRVMPAVGGHPGFDATYALASLTDRFARRDATGDVGTALPLPPNEVRAPWAALSPARSGWQHRGSIAASRLQEAARQGISDVASGTPDGAGAAAVAMLRERTWSTSLPLDQATAATGAGTAATGATAAKEAPPLSAGSAFAAYSLGFLRPGETAQVHHCAPWTRLSLSAGHVLSR